MSCSPERAALPALLYSDLEPAAAATLRAHLAACPECRREYAALEQVRGLLHVLIGQRTGNRDEQRQGQ